MDALVKVLVDEVLILHCHENGACHAVALSASSELSQSADCQSERSRVFRPDSIEFGRRTHKYLSIHRQEKPAQIDDSQRFTTERQWIIVRTQNPAEVSQRAMLQRKRASEMDCSRVRLCQIVNRVQSNRRVRSSQKWCKWSVQKGNEDVLSHW